MAANDESPILDPDIQRLLRAKAWKMIGRGGFRPQDRQDLEHELTARALQRLAAYDPSRGPLGAFLATVLEHARADILRYRLAQKRSSHRLRALGTDVGPDDLMEGSPQHECSSGPEQTDLVLDVAEVLDRLPPHLREVAEQLKFESPAAVARRRGVPPSTLYGDIRRLRQVFEAAGLRIYL